MMTINDTNFTSNINENDAIHCLLANRHVRVKFLQSYFSTKYFPSNTRRIDILHLIWRYMVVIWWICARMKLTEFTQFLITEWIAIEMLLTQYVLGNKNKIVGIGTSRPLNSKKNLHENRWQINSYNNLAIYKHWIPSNIKCATTFYLYHLGDLKRYRSDDENKQ